MKETPEHNERIAKLTFGSVYPLYLKKLLKKGRTEEELLEVIGWLTGLRSEEIKSHIESNATFEEFFLQIQINPAANMIKGVICGYRIEELENPLTKKIRYLDKLVDELAKGKPLQKVLRQP